MRVETTTNNRKAMAYALADRLGAECRYMGTPTYAYRVGNLTIERDGAVTGEHLELLAVTGWLLEHGYITELIPMVEQSAAENIEEQHAEKTTPDLEAAADESITHTCVFLPLSSFTPTGLKNLIRMLYARQRLICEMTRSRDIVIEPEVITTLQSDALTELPILERVLRESIDHGFIKGIDLEDGRIGLVFPHDENDPTRWQHYAKLLLAIVDKAKAATRVNTVMIEPEDSEMKYFCRGFLLQLGLGGAEYKELRSVLLDHLHGFLLDGNLEDRAVGSADDEAFVVGQVTAVAVGFCAAAVQQGVFEGLAVEQRPQAIDDLGFGDAFFVFVHGVSPSGLCALLI